jgi:hypothetical protein
MGRVKPRLLSQQLERVQRPVALANARDAPEHAERLDRARRFDCAHVLGIPAELIEKLRHDPLGVGVIAADVFINQHTINNLCKFQSG